MATIKRFQKLKFRVQSPSQSKSVASLAYQLGKKISMWILG